MACGTGILTRVLRTCLPSKVKLIVTDLTEPMFRQAAAKFGKGEKVRWLEADVSDLPFDDRKFDAVVRQFGVMFVPDKALATREACRVLKRDGLFLFNVWDAMSTTNWESSHIELSQATSRKILPPSTRFLLVTTLEAKSGEY